jgi:hypothetical protein
VPRILALVPTRIPELQRVQDALDRAWPIEKLPSSFDDLLKAIDEADIGGDGVPCEQ